MSKILFHASASGALLTEKQGTSFTETMKSRMAELESERDTGLNKNGNKCKWEGTTKPQELEDLIVRKNAPPELSDTAKTMVKKLWLWRELGIKKEIKSKFLDKGLYSEEDSISLLTEVENIVYVKNERRVENDYFTSECDIEKQFKDKKIIIDTKTSWDAETFINAKPSLDNEVQGEIYMESYDADEFHLKFCLVDCPLHLLQKEKDDAKRKYFAPDMTDEELQAMEEAMEPIYEQIERNLIYSTNPNIKKEDCIKTFVFYRNKERYNKLVEKAKMGQTYYKTLKLNTKL